MSQLVVLRHVFQRNFTILPNAAIRDDRLSWKALGVLAYLLSLPPSQGFQAAELGKQRASGKDATRAGLKELELVGYLRVTKGQCSNGRFEASIWTVTDRPGDFEETMKSPGTENPHTETPGAETPEGGNPAPDNPKPLRKEQKQKPNQKQKKQETKTPLGDAGDDRLRFPAGLPGSARREIDEKTSALAAKDLQMLLDELAVKMNTPGAIKTTPIQYFFGLVERFKVGKFVSTVPKDVPEDRPAPPPRSDEGRAKSDTATDGKELGKRALKKLHEDLGSVA